MIRLMVQGDRDAKGIEDAVHTLGTLCKERDIGLNVGEAGKIVRILAETGAHVRVHQAKPEKPNVPAGCTNVEVVDCGTTAEGAEGALGEYWPEVTRFQHMRWAVRLAALATSDGFIFFPGREGTLAHLVPIMAFIAKGEVDKGVARPRRVALINWSGKALQGISDLFPSAFQVPPWCRTPTVLTEEDPDSDIPSTPMDEVIRWLTEGLPA